MPATAVSRVSVEQVLALLALLIGGGGLAALLKARHESRKTRAEAQAIEAKTDVEVDSLAVSSLKETLTTVTTENARLVARLKTVDAENDEYRRQIDALREEIQRLRDALTGVERRLEALQRTHPETA